MFHRNEHTWELLEVRRLFIRMFARCKECLFFNHKPKLDEHLFFETGVVNGESNRVDVETYRCGVNQPVEGPWFEGKMEVLEAAANDRSAGAAGGGGSMTPRGGGGGGGGGGGMTPGRTPRPRTPRTPSPGGRGWEGGATDDRRPAPLIARHGGVGGALVGWCEQNPFDPWL